LKARICRSFNRAAGTYDAHADVQIEVGRDLLAMLPSTPCRRILDIGCGTGCFTSMLSERFPDAEIWAIDISPAMVKEACRRLGHRIHAVTADGEHLPHSIQGPFDLITSNSVFQWFDDVHKALGRYRDILAPGGVLAFSAFGPETLKELGHALDETFGGISRLPARNFPSKSALSSLMAVYFHNHAVDERRISRAYPTLQDLLHSLKGTGVAPVKIGGPLQLTKSRLKLLDVSYRRRFGEIRSTYQVFFCEGYSAYNFHPR